MAQANANLALVSRRLGQDVAERLAIVRCSGSSVSRATGKSLAVLSKEASMMLLAVTVLPDGGEKYLKVRDSGTISASNSSVQRMLRIPKSVYQSVREHGEQAYPHECCGVLLGKCDGNGERVVMRAVRCGNTRTDSPQNRYNIDPRELIRIQLDSRKDGLDILGFYHSHPDHPAQWSETDFSEAHWLGCSYVISSVEQGRATVTNSFLLTGESEDNKRFEDESIRTFSQVNQQVTVLP